MAKGKRINIKMASTKSPHFYTTSKNKQENPEKLKLRKYDPITRQHEDYVEEKIKS
jgi:large subunit ribosomal protein L33